MSKKINYDNLYVACYAYDYEVETEMYVQYETSGIVEHRIIINPKKKLIYSEVDENGKERLYDYNTGEEVFEESYESSFATTSSAMESLYCGYINGYTCMPIEGLRRYFLDKHNQKKHTVGYLIPLNEYVEGKLGINITSLSPAKLNKLVRLMNIVSGRPFMLSMDPEKAKSQLEKIGYRKPEKKK